MKAGTAELMREARENVRALGVEELIRAGFIPRDGRYFPAVLYPPVPMYQSLNEEDFFKGNRSGPRDLFAVYAHIPFCLSRCRFCHFVSFEGISSGEKDAYLDAFEREMDLYLDRLGLDRVPTGAINVGGGTATCLSPRQLDRFLELFTRRLDLGASDQFTYDVDVTTLLGAVGRERLKILHDHGVDRITIGAQVFNDGLLRDMNRTNTGEDVRKAVGNCRDAGIDNICIDLIYGYPGQTPENWIATMEEVVSMEIDSFQIYRLRIKPHNLLPGSIAERYARSPGDFPSCEDIYVMKALGVMLAHRNGFSDDRYTTVFSRSSRGISEYHRRKFCDFSDVLGFGLAANNILGGNVGIKTGNLVEYCARIREGRVPVTRGRICTRDDILRRSVVGPLRNLSAIDKLRYRNQTGLDVSIIFGGKLEDLKSFDVVSEKQSEFELTRRGHFFVDESCIQFFHPDFVPFPEEAYEDGILNPYRQTLPLPGS